MSSQESFSEDILQHLLLEVRDIEKSCHSFSFQIHYHLIYLDRKYILCLIQHPYNGRAIAAGFQASRGLTAAPVHAALPQASYAAAQTPMLPPAQAYEAPQAAAPDPLPPQPQAQQAYAQPPQSYAQQAPYSAPQTQPTGMPAPMPAFNAPGYASVPPAAAAPAAARQRGIRPDAAAPVRASAAGLSRARYNESVGRFDSLLEKLKDKRKELVRRAAGKAASAALEGTTKAALGAVDSMGNAIEKAIFGDVVKSTPERDDKEDRASGPGRMRPIPSRT